MIILQDHHDDIITEPILSQDLLHYIPTQRTLGFQNILLYKEKVENYRNFAQKINKQILSRKNKTNELKSESLQQIEKKI